MLKLNLPPYQLRIKDGGDRTMIFDSIRKKFVVLTPEEWVRQNFIMFLIQEKGIPASLISVEKGLTVNKTQKRTDIVVFDRNGHPALIVECKAPSVKVTQAVFDQIARYNLTLKGRFLVVTNGMEHYCCHMFHDEKRYEFCQSIPHFSQFA